MTLQKSKQRRAASRYLPFAHHHYNLVERQVRLFLDDGEKLLGVILQRRAAPAVGLGLDGPLMPPQLMPANRRADTDTEALRGLLSRGSLVDRFNHTHSQIRRIGIGHGASPKTESHAKTPPFRATWESEFNPNGNRSN